jgi:hypothetical protein
MSPIMTLCGLDKHAHENFFPLHSVCKLTAPALLYSSVLGLTGCATSAPLESLRAEVAKSNATVVAESEVSSRQCELASLQAAATPPEILSESRAHPTAALPRSTGYKWGKLPYY